MMSMSQLQPEPESQEFQNEPKISAPPAPAEKSQCVKGNVYIVKGSYKRWDGKQWRKVCEAKLCTRLAVGATVLCKAHGGGKRCEFKNGCEKSAVDATRFCKAHGGGKRCKHVDCQKSAVGKTPYCKGHGGGRRCGFDNCTKSAVGSTKFCIGHGGGKRCATNGCTKSARGSTDHCISHGGGRRCDAPGCKRSARGVSRYCITHRPEQEMHKSTSPRMPPGTASMPNQHPQKYVSSYQLSNHQQHHQFPMQPQQPAQRQHSMSSIPPPNFNRQRKSSLSSIFRIPGQGFDFDPRRQSFSGIPELHPPHDTYEPLHPDFYSTNHEYEGSQGQPPLISHGLLTPRPVGKRKYSDLFMNLQYGASVFPSDSIGAASDEKTNHAQPHFHMQQPPLLSSRQPSEDVMSLIVPMEMSNYYGDGHEGDGTVQYGAMKHDPAGESSIRANSLPVNKHSHDRPTTKKHAEELKMG